MGKRMLVSGNEAVALAARDCGVALGTGYPGTPSTEILETFAAHGGQAQWAPNEKVALEVAIGAAFGRARVLVTMKHVGLNVAADPLFTAAYCSIDGGLVVVSADDPGLASSQNEQDNRRYAVAAGIPMLEPSDSQEAYDFLFRAFEIAEKWHIPVLFRMTTRVCHAKCAVMATETLPVRIDTGFERNVKGRVMIPGNARAAHRNLRAKLAEIAEYNETATGLCRTVNWPAKLGIITSGIAYQHCLDAAPEAAILKIGLTYPLPLRKMREFADGVERCLIIEEGDPVMRDAAAAAGICVEDKPEMYRFGELNVGRVRRIINRDESPESPPPPGKPPQLCVGCPHRKAFETLRDLGCIVAGDIGCYTLGVLPPFNAMDICVCMGAGIGIGLGLRHVLPPEQAARVVSVIGDSTFIHSGVSGIIEMTYNRPATGHVVLILDNAITAMTGLQEHPGTGYSLDHIPASRVIIEDLVKSLQVDNVDICDPTLDPEGFRQLLERRLQSHDLSVIIARRQCLLAAAKRRQYEQLKQN